MQQFEKCAAPLAHKTVCYMEGLVTHLGSSLCQNLRDMSSDGSAQACRCLELSGKVGLVVIGIRSKALPAATLAVGRLVLVEQPQ